MQGPGRPPRQGRIERQHLPDQAANVHQQGGRGFRSAGLPVRHGQVQHVTRFNKAFEQKKNAL